MGECEKRVWTIEIEFVGTEDEMATFSKWILDDSPGVTNGLRTWGIEEISGHVYLGKDTQVLGSPVIPPRSFNRICDTAGDTSSDYTISVYGVTGHRGRNETNVYVRVTTSKVMRAVKFIYVNGRFHHAMHTSSEIGKLEAPDPLQRIRTLQGGLRVIAGQVE